MPPASWGRCRVKCNKHHGVSNPAPGGDGDGGVRGNMRPIVVGNYLQSHTWGTAFETLSSVFKLTPSLFQKTDQGHSLESYNHSSRSSPGSSHSPLFPDPKQESFPLSSFLANMSPQVRQYLVRSDSLLAETYFPGSYTHGPNSVLQP